MLDLLFVLVRRCDPIFLGLGSVDHDGLAPELLVGHGKGHEDGLWRVELHVGDSNKNRSYQTNGHLHSLFAVIFHGIWRAKSQGPRDMGG